MFYVYILRSVTDPEKIYVGYTNDIQKRLDIHNDGGATYTARYKPWVLIWYASFLDEAKALVFEKYLKSGSGKALAYKYFCN